MQGSGRPEQRADIMHVSEVPDDLPPPPRLPDALDRIGSGLRDAYAEAAAEPLPEAFEDLLRRLG